MWTVRATAYSSGDRGFNSGVVLNSSMGSDYVYHYRDIRAYNNGTTCNTGTPTHWCSGAGIDTSGNDWANNDVSRNFIIGATLFGNWITAEGTYGGGYQEVWHATDYNNGGIGYSGTHALRAEAKNQLLFNSIDTFQGTTAGFSFEAATADASQPQHQFTPMVMNNCFRPRLSDSESLGAADASAGWPGKGTYANPPSWIGSTNKVGLTNCDPKFVSLDTTTFANNDFHLQAGSTAIDTGRFLTLANGAGSSSTMITVKANGGSADPRYYFIQPSSYLDAVADTVQIKGATCTNAATELGSAERAKITSMNATQIFLDRICTWPDGAGVHLPWNGNAPDMGAYEYSSTNCAFGDLDCSGAVDILDLQRLVNVLLGTETDSAVIARADLNGDGSATVQDLQLLVNKLLGV